MRIPEHAAEFWARRVDDYDAYIRRVVPRYDEALDRLVAYAPPFSTCLELGCGTGNLTVRLARARPDAAFTVVDGSAEMLDVARARLAHAAPATAARARFEVGRFEELRPDGAHDLVIAALSLHHVPDVAAVYRELGRAVAPGGSFLIYDGVRGASDGVHARHLARWHEFWRRPGGLSGEEIEEVIEHIRAHDTYHPLRDHFRWLLRCGLARVDCVWRDGLFAIVLAARSSGCPSPPGAAP